jgi:DNA-directed RNA polymerase specialized sigma subunit
MNAKEYLNQAYKLNHRINSKLEQMEVLKSLSMKVTTCFSNVKVMHSSTEKSQMEKTLVRIIDLGIEINNEIDELIRLKSEIADTIHEIDDVNCGLLLEKRYISGKSWEEIADEMQYSISGIYRIHGEALKKVSKTLKLRK